MNFERGIPVKKALGLGMFNIKDEEIKEFFKDIKNNYRRFGDDVTDWNDEKEVLKMFGIVFDLNTRKKIVKDFFYERREAFEHWNL